MKQKSTSWAMFDGIIQIKSKDFFLFCQKLYNSMASPSISNKKIPYSNPFTPIVTTNFFFFFKRFYKIGIRPFLLYGIGFEALKKQLK